MGIKKIQPSGPYYLVGYCLGGTIALEMARQLKYMGENVAFLAMFEGYNIHIKSPTIPIHLKFVHKIQQFYFQLGNIMQIKSGHRFNYLKEKHSIEIKR